MARPSPRTAAYSAYRSSEAPSASLQPECGTRMLYESAPPWRKSATMALYGRPAGSALCGCGRYSSLIAAAFVVWNSAAERTRSWAMRNASEKFLVRSSSSKRDTTRPLVLSCSRPPVRYRSSAATAPAGDWSTGAKASLPSASARRRARFCHRPPQPVLPHPKPFQQLVRPSITSETIPFRKEMRLGVVQICASGATRPASMTGPGGVYSGR
mmetsp:Transcript_25867/g.82763  ORF Transcript_25867/g.82763 Transcript_25867/m.82763 type:complete len:213 (+) Transcript_25867:337-975(+)